MRVVFAASEGVPFSKTGGLADVVGGLPPALARQGHDVAVFLPLHRRCGPPVSELSDLGTVLKVPVGIRTVQGRVFAGRLPGSGVPVYLIDQPAYFDRDGLYGTGGNDYVDNCERFVFFNRAVLGALPALGLAPDVIHCHDWQTGLVPIYCRTLHRRLGGGGAPPATVQTIHNLAYLGLFWHWDMPLTGLDWSLFNFRQLEFHGRISFLKAGLVFADAISTVSPTYAREIQTPRYGSGLDDLLRERRADLFGIVNGIDPEVWSPARGTMLAARYTAADVVEGKARCKAWLQRASGLRVCPDTPLFAQIGRLDPQKGWDLLAEVADRLLERDTQLIVLGTGHPKYHALLEDLARRHPGRCSVKLAFDETLAHQIEAGADLFLMPSLFEPCGLSQLYSLAHGTLPIVRATGGLRDTVVDATPVNLANGTANGFQFEEPTSEALWHAIERALALWADRGARADLMKTGMSADWSWDRSASEYARLYETARRAAAAGSP